MWKVTRKGLAGHKLRFLLTALAVVLGVSFIAGTLVLTATIQKTFDDLFANINRGTDAAVRSSNVIKGNFGNDQRANVPESLVAVVKSRRRRSRPRSATSSPTRRRSTTTARPSAATVRRPSGSAGTRTRS